MSMETVSKHNQEGMLLQKAQLDRWTDVSFPFEPATTPIQNRSILSRKHQPSRSTCVLYLVMRVVGREPERPASRAQQDICILRSRAPKTPAEWTAGEYGWVWPGERKRKLVRDVARDYSCSDRTE